jgi:hypothetical protein
MRCADLAGTWTELLEWFGQRGVLVLPQLTADTLLVRLDADIDQKRTATPEEVARAADRLRAVIDHFGVQAVYVQQTPSPSPGRVCPEPAVITARVVAGGVVHELTLFAAWYYDYLDEAVEMEFAATS